MADEWSVPLLHSFTLYILCDFPHFMYQMVTGCLVTRVNCRWKDSEVVFRSDKDKVKRLAASQQFAYLSLEQRSWNLKTKRTHTLSPHWHLLISCNGFNKCWEWRGASLYPHPPDSVNEWMTGYQHTPSHPATLQPAARDSAAICLPCRSDRTLFTLWCEESIVVLLTAVNMWKDTGRSTRLHHIRLATYQRNTFVWIVQVEWKANW